MSTSMSYLHFVSSIAGGTRQLYFSELLLIENLGSL